jgi:hypothetical protein
MQFAPTDHGPCWMNPVEREDTRKDRPSGKTTKFARRVAELKKDLQAKGVLGTGNKKELQQLCASNDAPNSIQTQGIVEGWEGKAKGMLQILFEQGFLDPSKIVNRDPSKITEHTVDRRNDAFRNLLPETSLRCHMARLSDFQNNETLMQHHGKSLGVKVDQTPKFHPEMAGEGVEHSWAGAKGFCRRLPPSEKRSKAKFRKAVSRCIDTEQVLTAGRERMFTWLRLMLLTMWARIKMVMQMTAKEKIHS